jgi:hypothetical protein
MSATPSFLEAAIELAEGGWKVFPIRPRDKRPLTRHGLKEATADIEQIREWWQEWPEANIGVATGQASGIVVLDVDDRHGGREALRDLVVKHGALPVGVACETGGGGKHLYFAAPAFAARNSVGKLGAGLDVRGDGGYVVAPPSVHESGSRYAWLSHQSPSNSVLPTAPTWLLSAIDSRRVANDSRLAKPTSIPEGGRNHHLISLAGALRRKGCDYDVILAALLAENRSSCTPALPDDEVRAIAQSGASYPKGGTFSDGVAQVVCVADVQPEQVDWLWYPRIPFGKLTVLDGDPGQGQSTLSLAVAAAVTTGGMLPGQALPLAASSVLLISMEDGVGDTIRPRLQAARADLERVRVITGIGSDARTPSVPDDLEEIERVATEMEARLIVVDPLMAVLSGGTNAHRDQDVRRALVPLTRLAERTRSAILIVRHLNKAQGGSAIYRGGGSIGIIGAARSGLLAAADPDDPNGHILAQVKSNLGPPAPSLKYSLVPSRTDSSVAVIAWGGTCELRPDDLVATQPPESTAPRKSAASHWLRDMLANGPVFVEDLKTSAEDAGFAWRTIERAKESIGIEAKKSTFNGGWQWSLSTANAANTKGLAAFANTARAPSSETAESTPKAATNGEDRQLVLGARQ